MPLGKKQNSAELWKETVLPCLSTQGWARCNQAAGTHKNSSYWAPRHASSAPPTCPGGNQASATALLWFPPPTLALSGTGSCRDTPSPTSSMGEAPLLGSVQPRSSARNFAINEECGRSLPQRRVRARPARTRAARPGGGRSSVPGAQGRFCRARAWPGRGARGGGHRQPRVRAAGAGTAARSSVSRWMSLLA